MKTTSPLYPISAALMLGPLAGLEKSAGRSLRTIQNTWMQPETLLSEGITLCISPANQFIEYGCVLDALRLDTLDNTAFPLPPRAHEAYKHQRKLRLRALGIRWLANAEQRGLELGLLEQPSWNTLAGYGLPQNPWPLLERHFSPLRPQSLRCLRAWSGERPWRLSLTLEGGLAPQETLQVLSAFHETMNLGPLPHDVLLAMFSLMPPSITLWLHWTEHGELCSYALEWEASEDVLLKALSTAGVAASEMSWLARATGVLTNPELMRLKYVLGPGRTSVWCETAPQPLPTLHASSLDTPIELPAVGEDFKHLEGEILRLHLHKGGRREGRLMAIENSRLILAPRTRVHVDSIERIERLGDASHQNSWPQ